MNPAPAVGVALPTRSHSPDEVQLMLYNAVLWNGHRIHFDLPYATEVEGYPGLVLAGPMLGDWLHQVVDEWLGEAGVITSVSYSNRGATYVGDTLTAGATVTAWDASTGALELDVFIKNEAGEVVAPGKIGAQLTPGENA
ncbi:MAG: hypothetical protein PVJ95_04660 [Cellvibrionales bacterium]|jgi:3-methylfumaryl-CoA hydratase